jgi:signal transduction histidine kinase
LAQDALLALFVTVMQVQGSQSTAAAKAAAAGEGTARALTDLGGLGYVLIVVGGVVLVARRKWPVAVVVATGLVSLAYYSLGFPDGPIWLGLFIALYTLTAHGDGRRSLVIAGVSMSILTTAWLVAAADIEPRESIGWVFFRIGASVMSAALGESARSRRVIAAEAEERAERAERTRDEEARARVDAERLRIAREVHDTVAHSIAVINVQAGVTAHVLDKRPERARETLLTIEQMSSQALQEMRNILGVLRDDEADRAPQPGLGQLDELAATAREAGLDVEVTGAPTAAGLPSAVDSAAYRILQESITNVIRHVGPTRVDVRIEPGADLLEIRVINDGSPDAPGEPGSIVPGRGIAGMRERCELLGGELHAGPGPGGGFEVTARLPLAPAEVTQA